LDYAQNYGAKVLIFSQLKKTSSNKFSTLTILTKRVVMGVCCLWADLQHSIVKYRYQFVKLLLEITLFSVCYAISCDEIYLVFFYLF